MLHYNSDLWDLFCSLPVKDEYTKSGLWPFSVAISIFNGRAPVIIFFILSGYVLSASILRSGGSYIPFIIKRVGRIYPTVIAAILLTLVVGLGIKKFIPSFPLPSLENVIKNSLLIDSSVLHVTWTLTEEMAFALIVYPLCLLVKRYGILVLFVALFYSIAAIERPSLTLNIPWLNISLIFFICGMLLNTNLAKSIFSNKQKYLALAFISVFTIGRIYQEFSPNYILTQAILCTTVIGIIIYNKDGRIVRFLENRFSLLIGKTSYSLYLFAVPVGLIVYAVLDYSGSHRIAFGIFAGFIILAISIPLSMITYNFIEKPSIKITRAISKLPILNRVAKTTN